MKRIPRRIFTEGFKRNRDDLHREWNYVISPNAM